MSSIASWTCYMEMVAPAVEQLFGNVPYELSDVKFEHILYLDNDAPLCIRLSMEPMRQGESSDGRDCLVRVESSRGGEEWSLHASMRLRVGSRGAQGSLDVEGAVGR